MPLKVSDGIGAWISDFKKSDAPQFNGKSEKERRDMALAAYLSAKKESTNESYIKEEASFKVDIEGLPTLFMTDASVGQIMAKLRSIVKQPSLINKVERVTDHEVKKTFRLKAQGRDDEEEVEESYSKEWGTTAARKYAEKITPGQGKRIDEVPLLPLAVGAARAAPYIVKGVQALNKAGPRALATLPAGLATATVKAKDKLPTSYFARRQKDKQINKARNTYMRKK